MWHRLSDDIIQARTRLVEKKPVVPRWLQSVIAVILFGAFFYALSYLSETYGWFTAQNKAGQALSLQNASWTTLATVFIVTVIFAYFLLIKNRKPPVIFICYDCQEAFHAAANCPECNRSNISDIRFAEWIEEAPEHEGPT